MQSDTKSNSTSNTSIDPQWESAWDHSLQKLVTECFFDFKVVSSRLNQQFNSSKFTEDNVQARWGQIHKQRKTQTKKQQSNVNKPETAQSQMENLLDASKPPMEEPKKSLTLKELTQNLPQTRQKKDFLDPSTSEIDKQFDITFDGQHIKPSGFNILKDKVRLSPEEQKKREEEFLKNLSKMIDDKDEIDIDAPFIFKANFLNDNQFNVEKLDYQSQEAQEMIRQSADFKNLKTIEKDFERDQPAVKKAIPPTFEPENKENLKNEGPTTIDVVVTKTADGNTETTVVKKEDNEKKEELAKKNLETIFEQKNKALEMFEKGSIDEVLSKFQKIQFIPKSSVTEKIREDIKKQLGENELVIEDIEVSKPKAESKSREEIPETKPANLEDLEAEEIEDFEDFDSDEEFIERQRKGFKGDEVSPKKRVKKQKQPQVQFVETKLEEPIEKPVQSKVEPKATEVKESEAKPTEKKEKIDAPKFEEKVEEILVIQKEKEVESDAPKTEIMQEITTSKDQNETRQVRVVINDNKSRTIEVKEDPSKVHPLLAEMEQKREGEKLIEVLEKVAEEFRMPEVKRRSPIKREDDAPEEHARELDPEEAKLQADTQLEIDEQTRKLALLLKDLDRRNEEYEKEIAEKERKAKEDEEKKIFEEKVNKRKNVEDHLKNAWTNSYVPSFFDDRIAYLPKISPVPHVLINHFNKKEVIDFREIILHRYQTLSLPILADQGDFVTQILDFFLKYSNFNCIMDEEDKSTNFHFHLIGFGIYATYDNKKESLPDSIYNKRTSDFLYLLFDCYEGRGDQVIDKIIKNTPLTEIFDRDCLKTIQNSAMFKDDSAHLQDIVSFLNKSIEAVSDTFLIDSAVTGICLDEGVEDSRVDYESTVILMNYVQKEYLTIEAKTKGLKKSNLRSLRKKLAKENLFIIGCKSIYLTKDDISDFKSKIGMLYLNSPLPLLAIAVGGFRAVSKVKNIIGNVDFDLARKNEPRSINAKYGNIRSSLAVFPTSKSLAKKWMHYFFGGRIDDSIFMNVEKKKRPINFEVITKPIKRAHCLISSKLGNTHLPIVLRDITDKGYFIENVHLITRNTIHQVLLSAGSDFAEQYLEVSNTYDLDCFKFSCNNTQNACNFLITFSGQEPEFLQHFIFKKHFKESDGKVQELVSIMSSPAAVDIFDKIFNSKKFKFSNTDFTKGTGMKYYAYLAPVSSSSSMYTFADECATLTFERLELIGFSTLKSGQVKGLRSTFKDNLTNALSGSKSLKKLKEFQNFVEKTLDYMETNNFAIALFRSQNPLKSTNDISKLPVFANSNFYVPETSIYIYGTQDKQMIVNHEVIEKFFFEYNCDEIVQMADKAHITLGDDRTIKDSFIYDMPPVIDGIEPSSEHTTTVMISQFAIKYTSISYTLKFFEQAGFSVEKLNFCYLSEDVVNSIHFNLENTQGSDIANWSKLKERLVSDPFWILSLKKYNAIFECKSIMKDFLKRIFVFEGNLVDNTIDELTLASRYGVYCSRSFEDSERDSLNIQLHYDRARDLHAINRNEGPTNLVPIDANSKKSEVGFILFRNKNLPHWEGFHDFFSQFQTLRLKIMNFKYAGYFDEQEIEIFSQIFGMKHDKDSLRGFLGAPEAHFYLIPVEYKFGTTLYDTLGSFKLKANSERAIFSNGHFIQKYGCEFLYTSTPQDVSKLVCKYFGVIDSQDFKLE